MRRESVTVSARGLHRAHEDRVVFHRLAFEWAGPGVVCVRGPNGSGKTTLLAMLGGAAAPDDGDLLVMGRSLVSERDRALPLLAYVPDAVPVYPFVTGGEWLDFVRAVRRPAAWTAPALASRFGLDAYLGTRFGAMSLGTARKFMLAAGLGAPAPLVVLDEPTNGLDAAALEVLRERIVQLAAEGLVVMCCHDVDQQRALGARCVDLAALEAS